MPHVVVDAARCQGYANCIVESELFDLGPDSRAVYLDTDVPEPARVEVENAVRACPAAAIRIVEQ
jgi:ferredoxin